MVVTEIFPTIFALRIGEEFNIIPKTKKNMTSKNHEELREKMEMMISAYLRKRCKRFNSSNC